MSPPPPVEIDEMVDEALSKWRAFGDRAREAAAGLTFEFGDEIEAGVRPSQSWRLRGRA